ncbi:MAG: ATP-binding cassette domain-containing protein [Ruminococcaceae bacterium]|nr:ATP-binding cassette domain-containing protein [Oscillospiraceae bacterium]
MSNTKKLLSITNLKKYFPIAKSSLFQKEQLYVRANEDITIDIYEGETLGIVGESGCGKSTLGRVLLQLYPQTAGTTMYYGTTLDILAPSYIEDTLRHFKKYKAAVLKAEAKYDAICAKVDEVGEDNADFFLLQDRNLAQSDAKTKLDHVAKIVGGFYVMDDAEGDRGRADILAIHRLNVQKNVLVNDLNDTETLISKISDDGIDKKEQKQYNKLMAKKARLEAAIDAINVKINENQTAIDAIRDSMKADPEFARYEAMRDSGIDLSRLKYKEMRTLRKDMQIIFQDPYSSLNPRFTIGQIIEEGLLTHKMFRSGSQKMREHVVDTMKKCGLQEYMLHRYPHQFSGGQRQRISIARALAVNPKFVVCDECVSALDVSIQSQIINLLQELKEKEKLTYMFISHDLSVVRYISDRICVMYLGNVVELADAATIFADPRHPYTVALLSSIPTTDVDKVGKERILLEGNIPSPIRPPEGCKFHTRCYMACDKCKRVPPPLVEVEPGHYVACHRLEKKLDENGNYTFETATERRTERA